MSNLFDGRRLTLAEKEPTATLRDPEQYSSDVGCDAVVVSLRIQRVCTESSELN